MDTFDVAEGAVRRFRAGRVRVRPVAVGRWEAPREALNPASLVVAQGWLATFGTRGTFVSDRLPEPVSLIATTGADSDSDGSPEYSFRVVPDPQVGSRTRSPGSVVIKMARSGTLVLVWTT